MKRFSVPLLLAAAALVAVVLRAASANPSASTDQIARGRYLVHQVAMCVDCHSPRNEMGQFIEPMHLMGSPLGFAPTVPMPAWAEVAPPIGGALAGYTVEQEIQFLMTGERPAERGGPTRPPMPEIRMNRADAEAVTAYLRSLSPPAN